MKILKAAFFSFHQQHQPLDEVPFSNPADAVTETGLNEIVIGFAFFNTGTVETSLCLASHVSSRAFTFQELYRSPFEVLVAPNGSGGTNRLN